MTNLDCMHTDELLEFYLSHKNGNAVSVRLARYAHEKRAAMRYRELGLINAALHAEEACDAIYRQLPEEERW